MSLFSNSCCLFTYYFIISHSIFGIFNLRWAHWNVSPGGFVVSFVVVTSFFLTCGSMGRIIVRCYKTIIGYSPLPQPDWLDIMFWSTAAPPSLKWRKSSGSWSGASTPHPVPPSYNITPSAGALDCDVAGIKLDWLVSFPALGGARYVRQHLSDRGAPFP